MLTRKEALCFALEIAIQSKREKVPTIAQQLVNEYTADDMVFGVHGTPFSRTRLSNWAREGLTPGLPPLPPPRVTDLGKALYRPSGQNVHDEKVVSALNKQLGVIRERVPQTARISQAAALAEISAYLDTTHTAQASHQGLTYLGGLIQPVTGFSDSVQGSLCVLWNHIRNTPDPVMRQNLKDSMAAKLREIGSERPCAVGMITRIIDIPTAIDWSLTSDLSFEHLRQELITLAGAVNEECAADPDLQNQATLLANHALLQHEVNPSAPNEAAPNEATVIQTELTKLIRDRFLNTADIEFGMLRCIDRQIIKTEAERVFPENTIL